MIDGVPDVSRHWPDNHPDVLGRALRAYRQRPGAVESVNATVGIGTVRGLLRALSSWLTPTVSSSCRVNMHRNVAETAQGIEKAEAAIRERTGWR